MTYKKEVVRGVKWTSFSMIIVTVARFIQMAVLARFLEPADFGLMAVLMVVIGFAQAFQDMGISNAVIQRQDISHTQLSSLYWLNIISGAFLSLLVLAISPLISNFYNENRIIDLLRLLSISFFLVAVGNQYRVLLQKNMDFVTLEIINIVSALVALIISILFAFSGFGVLSLVLAMLCQVGVASLLFLYIGFKNYHKPSLVYRHSELNGFYEFGLYQVGERIINYLSTSADKLLIGKFLGLNAVGIYNLAWNLVIFPLSSLNPIVNKVSFPIYSRCQHDKALLDRYYRLSLRALSLVVMPILAFLLFFSREAVLVVYGAGWGGVSELLPALVLVGVVKALGNPGGAIILALGRADVGFWWNLIWAVFVVSGLIMGLVFVPSVQVAVYVLLVLSLSIGLIWHVIIARISLVNYAPIIRHLLRLFCVVTGIAWIGFFVTELTSVDQPLFRIGVGGVVCALLYIIYIFLYEKDLLLTLRKEL